MSGENRLKRAEVVKAMETLARCINDEDIFESWLMVGVADGDIDSDTELEDVDGYYTEDKNFSELMDLFLRLMSRAKNDDTGLYCDGIVSGHDKY